MEKAIEKYAKKEALTVDAVEDRIDDGDLIVFDTAEELFEWLYIEDAMPEDMEATMLALFHFRDTVTEDTSFGEAFLLDEDRIVEIDGQWFCKLDV